MASAIMRSDSSHTGQCAATVRKVGLDRERVKEAVNLLVALAALPERTTEFIINLRVFGPELHRFGHNGDRFIGLALRAERVTQTPIGGHIIRPE